ncbi:MAG: hypothetical protein ACE5I7_06845 [Candidatus Binatia bacterium]
MVVAFFAADCATVSAYLVDWWVGGLTWNHGLRWKLATLFDLHGPGTLVVWYSSVQLFSIAFLLAIFAYLKLDGSVKASWLLPFLPLLFLVLSFEQIAALHEWLGYKRGALWAAIATSRDLPYLRDALLWLAVAVGAVALGVAYSLKRYLSGRAAGGAKCLLGALVCFGSAGGIGALAGLLPGHTTARVLLLALQVLGELVGVTIILWATHDLLVAHNIVLTAEPSRHDARRGRR